jgi:hypothetical protein
MDPAHDLAVFRTMTEELPDYLLSDVLFWQMRAPSDYPKLSLRQMLLIRAHLRAGSPGLSPADQTRLAEGPEAGTYAHQVSNRVIAALLLAEFPALWAREPGPAGWNPSTRCCAPTCGRPDSSGRR